MRAYACIIPMYVQMCAYACMYMHAYYVGKTSERLHLLVVVYDGHQFIQRHLQLVTQSESRHFDIRRACNKVSSRLQGSRKPNSSNWTTKLPRSSMARGSCIQVMRQQGILFEDLSSAAVEWTKGKYHTLASKSSALCTMSSVWRSTKSCTRHAVSCDGQTVTVLDMQV